MPEITVQHNELGIPIREGVVGFVEDDRFVILDLAKLKLKQKISIDLQQSWMTKTISE